MSRTEHHIGKIKRINFNSEKELEHFCYHLLMNNDLLDELDEDYSAVECVLDELYEKYIVDEDGFNVYEIIESEELDESDYFSRVKPECGDIFRFECRFYNGGVSFEECIVEGMNELEEKEK